MPTSVKAAQRPGLLQFAGAPGGQRSGILTLQLVLGTALRCGDDEASLNCPLGAHARRTNPRDAPVLGSPRRHRIPRRGATFGPRLPPGALEDDGVDRGLLLAAVNAHIGRQFKFVQSHWINDGRFIGEPDEVDPLAAPHAEHDTFPIPQRPIRKQLRGLPTFVRNRGGHYGFIPSRRSLRWLVELGGAEMPE